MTYFQALLNYEEIRELINESDRYDNDPLHIAAMKGYLPIVRVGSCFSLVASFFV